MVVTPSSTVTGSAGVDWKLRKSKVPGPPRTIRSAGAPPEMGSETSTESTPAPSNVLPVAAP